MENVHPLPLTDAFENSFEQLFYQFKACMNAMQFQNLDAAENTLIQGKNIYSITAANATQGSKAIPFKIVVSFIEVATRLTRSTAYTLDERYRKAFEEQMAAKNICDNVRSIFDQVPGEFGEEIGFNEYREVFRFMLNFFERVLVSIMGTTKGSIDKAEGRFVDEIEINKIAAAELRKIEDQSFGPFNDGDNNYVVAMISMLNRFADFNDKRAERLEEQHKKIEFLSPIDKRVFIVHGHDHAALFELQIILEKEFKLDPIILVDALDNGKTLIEKFEHYGRLSAFAFVLVTSDDWVMNKKEKVFQARPNVLFELGWFCGRYGREKVRIIKHKDTSLPSDLNGIVTIEYTDRLKDVQLSIQSDLETAGIIEPKK